MGHAQLACEVNGAAMPSAAEEPTAAIQARHNAAPEHRRNLPSLMSPIHPRDAVF